MLLEEGRGVASRSDADPRHPVIANLQGFLPVVDAQHKTIARLSSRGHAEFSPPMVTGTRLSHDGAG